MLVTKKMFSLQWEEMDQERVISSMVSILTLYLLMSSADNFCKQFGPRSGPTKCRA